MDDIEKKNILSAIGSLIEGSNTHTLELFSLRVILSAVLEELSQDEERRDSLVQNLAKSIEWFSSHAINSQMTDKQVEQAVPHTISQIPRTIQPLVKQLLRLP